MTREERLFFCKKCTNRDFHLTEGILCKLTGKKATFEGTCPDYELDKKRLIKIQPVAAIRPNKNRALLAQNLIWAVLIMDLVTIISSYMQYDLLHLLKDDVFIFDDVLESNDMREGIVALLYSVIYIISAVTFIQWFRRAYYNLNNRTRCQHSEGWASGGWFVPILSLFRPYQIMKELHEKTVYLIKQRSQQTIEDNSNIIIGFWWGLWILSNYIGRYSFKAAFKADTIDALIESTIADMILSAVNIPLGILAILLIKSFAKKDEQLLELERKDALA